MNEMTVKCNGRDIRLQLRDEVDRSVCNEIFKLGEYRAAEETIRQAVQPIIDVGAHAGFFSLYCRALNPAVKIYALEPEPANQTALSHNLRLNKTRGVTLVSAALAATSGERQLVITTDNHNHRLLGADEKFTEQTIPVQAYSLADLAARFKIKQISLLKMDIEGGEYEVLDSLTAADWPRIQHIILEYHHQGRNTADRLEAMMRHNGFSVSVFPSRFDKHLGFLWARNKRI
ncbi:FkbM family methyltransferase [Candidatus Falkowbacteria bacterium]|nr:FkbM family methyltransferase [Candidatus Falkowbacteria bacterium]